MSDRCWWCGAEATRLCDALIGAERRASDNTIITGESYTCDAEMCRECARPIGHMCERGKGCDTIDRCPEHTDSARPMLHELATSRADAEKIRRNIRAKAMRIRIKVVR